MSTHKPATPKTKKAAIDWRTVHQRLDATRAAVERMELPNAEETRRILKTRAHALAREPAKTEAAADSLEVVEFLLAGASAVQVGTANFIQPDILPQMTEDLRRFMRMNNINQITDLVGGIKSP